MGEMGGWAKNNTWVAAGAVANAPAASKIQQAMSTSVAPCVPVHALAGEMTRVYPPRSSMACRPPLARSPGDEPAAAASHA